MKTQRKTTPAHKARSKAAGAKRKATKRAIRHAQPLHKRFALHPINILALLCVGVLLATFTLNALADSYTVSATLPAPPLVDPAVITDPPDGAQFSTQSITVSGTCPASSYVNLVDNSSYTGTGLCSNGAFQIALQLNVGTNVLQAQDYNITNSPGPSSSPITVTYTPPSVPPSPIVTPTPSPTATPISLKVLQVDVTIPYAPSTNAPEIVSYQPTFSGIAPPFSFIYIVIHSNVYTCSTYANAQGYWTCTVPEQLPVDIHTVDITARTPQGKTITLPPFEIRVVAAAPAVKPTKSPFSISSLFSYGVHPINERVSYTLSMNGGNPPYGLTVNWGDGQTNTYVRLSPTDYTISHTYTGLKSSIGFRTIKLQAVDATGTTATLQLIAVLRNPSYVGTVAHMTLWSGMWGLFSKVRPWLWLIWPGYAIVVLLVFSFWLGERQELIRLLGSNKKRIKSHHPLRR